MISIEAVVWQKHSLQLRAANNFPAGTGQIVWSKLFLLGHISFLAGQTLITSYRSKNAPIPPSHDV